MTAFGRHVRKSGYGTIQRQPNDDLVAVLKVDGKHLAQSKFTTNEHMSVFIDIVMRKVAE